MELAYRPLTVALAAALSFGGACAEGTSLDASGAGGPGAGGPGGGSGCPSGQQICDGACTDTSADSENCGDCGVACDPGFVCDGEGQCELSCQAGLTNCGGACTDTNTSDAHCGGCDAPCDPGEVCDGAGSCMLPCTDGTVDCGTGVCVDTSVDPLHCGGCDAPCPMDEECVDSGCAPICTPGSFTVDVPFTSTVGWTTGGCCSQTEYRVANGQGAKLDGTFLDQLPQGTIMTSVDVQAGIEHECSGHSMAFQLNGTPIGTWSDGQGPDCDCGNPSVATATFTTSSAPYVAGGSNTVSIVQTGTGTCHEAITTVPGTPAGTAFRITVSYGCP